jgi:hypothetical protein
MALALHVQLRTSKHGDVDRTFQPLVSVVLIYKHIICTLLSVTKPVHLQCSVDLLRWFSRGASVGGANVKLCICAVWGNSGRPVVSVGISTLFTQGSRKQRKARRGGLVSRRGCRVSAKDSEVVCGRRADNQL